MPGKNSLKKKRRYLTSYSLMLVDPDLDLIHMFHQPLTLLDENILEKALNEVEADDDDVDHGGDDNILGKFGSSEINYF